MKNYTNTTERAVALYIAQYLYICMTNDHYLYDISFMCISVFFGMQICIKSFNMQYIIYTLNKLKSFIINQKYL